ncbi:tyrosyl-tRNA synthetase mitochondrial precursor [Aspergillus ellipticus CBS 707.79]|uniref:Tyrosine--tRNA ligase n=1 Tax=Aspergillus ellipticus CBS 707.79 TaxID=1448320 RepID=A0A319D8U3_9EURO|nr:tyrosyl-tRNA synthetase mitochondrial precursor [Aspergillus ellipticus CBS 707.79]
MRLPSGGLPRTALLHNPPIFPGTRKTVPSFALDQKRCITQKHIQKTKQAEADWKAQAEIIKQGKAKSFLEHLEERGYIHNTVGDRDILHRVFTERRAGLYAGVDPTAPSLHVGHMLPFMILAWGYVWGLPVTFVLGGATARIGDPTGRLKGREPVHASIRKANMASMHMQLKKLGMSIEKYGDRHGYKKVWAWRRGQVNNNVWWNSKPMMDVIRDMGAHMRLGPMLGRDSVKNRLTEGDGMSFAEFCYPLMQAWDWFHLFRTKNAQIQVGGSDQYGNILFGMEAVKAASRNLPAPEERRSLSDDLEKPYGITTPLLTTSSGEKFGKSAGNAIWLDSDLTSSFELYQFFVRTPDDTVERYLKLFTFLPLPKIAEIMEEQNKDPSQRVAQHTLAAEFLELIHGPAEAKAVSLQHRQLFRPRSSTAEPTPLPPTPKSKVDPNSPVSGFINPAAGNIHAPQTNFEGMKTGRIVLPRSLVWNQPIHKVLWSAGLVASKSEGHRIIANNGVYVGARPDGSAMSDGLEFRPVKIWAPEKTNTFIVEGELLFFKIGKWKFRIIRIMDDEEFKKADLPIPPGWEEVCNAKDSEANVSEASVSDATASDANVGNPSQ